MSDLSLDKLLQKAENKLQNVHEIVQKNRTSSLGKHIKKAYLL